MTTSDRFGIRRAASIAAAGLAAFLLAGCATTPPVTGPSDRPSAPAAAAPRAEPSAPIVTRAEEARGGHQVPGQERVWTGAARRGGPGHPDDRTREIRPLHPRLAGGDLDLVLDEQDLGKSGIIKGGTGPKSGEVLGLNAIVTGAVSQFGVKQ